MLILHTGCTPEMSLLAKQTQMIDGSNTGAELSSLKTPAHFSTGVEIHFLRD